MCAFDNLRTAYICKILYMIFVVVQLRSKREGTKTHNTMLKGGIVKGQDE